MACTEAQALNARACTYTHTCTLTHALTCSHAQSLCRVISRFLAAVERSLRSKMFEQPADASIPQTGAANLDCDVSQAEVGDQKWEPAPVRPAEPVEGRMADECGKAQMVGPNGEGDTKSRRPRTGSPPPPQHENGPGQNAFPRLQREPEDFGPDLGQAQPVFGEEVPNTHGTPLRGFEVPNWVFMDVCRAREEAHDATWRTCYPSVYLDYFTFIEDLFASVALSGLAAELGCDRLKDVE